MGSYNLDIDKKVTELYFKYNETYSGGKSHSGGNSPYDSRSPSYTTFEPEGLYIKKPSGSLFDCETLDVPFDVAVGYTVYIPLVRYSTGDTFGTDEGRWYLEGIYQTLEEASDICVSIDEDKYRGDSCWTGYFDRLESTEVLAMTIRDEYSIDFIDVKVRRL